MKQPRKLKPLTRFKKKMERVEEIRNTSRSKGMLYEWRGMLVLWVEQRARDIFRDTAGTVSNARRTGVAGLCVDEVLLGKARDKGALIVMVGNEEMDHVYAAPLSWFFDTERYRARAFGGRRVRMIDLGNCKHIPLSR